jgi:hypothetical protein
VNSILNNAAGHPNSTLRALGAVFSAIAVTLSLCACATTGVRVDEHAVSALEKGKTTYGQVIQSLGPPTSTMLGANSQRTIMHTYAMPRRELRLSSPSLASLQAAWM